MNYTLTEQLEVYDASGNKQSETNLNIVYNGAEFVESGQSYVLTKFLAFELGTVYLNTPSGMTGMTKKVVNSQLVETYSDNESNNATYARITATAKNKITDDVTGKYLTFTIDNQPTNNITTWADALWARLNSIYGTTYTALTHEFINLNIVLHN